MATACELAHTLQNAHNSAVIQHAGPSEAPPLPPSSASVARTASPDEPGDANPKKATGNGDPPKKKPKAPKPQASYCSACEGHVSVALLRYVVNPNMRQGSELEVVMAGDLDPGTFVATWVSACTSAEGRATTLKSQ